ncbi:YceI family protein [Rhodothermus bifroesti]|uniref:YceI family protein n=1 Tax=Rhodothermus bifroesti TaxID=2823335 RepID=UPI000CAA4353|nr:YceI family protein [Rhodothermus bifroesti]GBD01853.1 Protein YceI [bacterium HR18]
MRRLWCLWALWVLLGSAGVLAQPVTLPVDSTQSLLQYYGHHPLHGWTGVSRSVQGKLHLDLANPARSTVRLHVPVASFSSGNSNRDSNMLEVVEADRFPEVIFESSAIAVERWEQTATGYEGAWVVNGRLTFHGQTQAVAIPVAVRINNHRFEATGRFSIMLSQFGVRRPKLLLMAIRDRIDLEGTIRAVLPPAAKAGEQSF